MARGNPGPLVGRESEAAALRAAVAEARAGELRCVLVTGEAGIGKTRLVSEVVDGLEDAVLLTGHGTATSTGALPFGVLAEVLRGFEHVAAVALTDAERADLAPLLPGGRGSEPVDATRVLGGGLDLLERLAGGERLLVLRIEDLQWADAGTRDLAHLAARSVHGRFLLVATVRTEDPLLEPSSASAPPEQVTALARLPHTTTLTLERLGVDDVHRLLATLPDRLTASARDAVADLSGGVPFVVEELAASEGRLGRTTLAGALADRLQRLGPAARDLVEAAAVGEGHLRVSLLGDVLRASPAELDAALDDAVGSGVLVADYPRDSIGFRHPLLRAAADEVITPSRRRECHRLWALALEANRARLVDDVVAIAIAEHWHHAGDRARSAESARAAVDAAYRTSDLNLVVTLWTRVLDCWDERDPQTVVGRLSLREVAGEAWNGTLGGDDDDVSEAFCRALLERGAPPPVQELIGLLRGLASKAKNDLEDFGFVIDAATACDWLVEPPDRFTQTALTLLGGFLPASHHSEATDLLDRAAELAEAFDDDERRLAVMKSRAVRHWRAGEDAGSVRVLEEAAHTSMRMPLHHRLNFAGDLGWTHLLLGDHRTAERVLLERLEATAHPEVLPGSWEHVLENLAHVWWCTGQWDAMRGAVSRAAVWWPDDVRLSNLAVAHADLLQRGRTDERSWRRHLDAPVPGGPDAVDVAALLAVAAGCRGDVAELRALTAAMLDGLAARRDPDDLAWRGLLDVARHEVALHDRAGVLEQMVRLREVASVACTARPHDRAARMELDACFEMASGGDPRQGLTDALRAWEQLDHVPDTAVVHLALAEASAVAGDREAAREHWLEGRRISTDLGARPWLDRAARIAATHGFADRGRSPGLTEREAEVLALLAQGRSNKEIAEELWISAKTASVHVSRIIAKTGAANRTQAVSLARSQGLLAED